MPTGVGAVAASMAFASPDERRRMAIPALDSVTKPVFENLHIVDMMSLQRSANDDALHRFGHVEPGAGTRRIQESNAAFMAPAHEIATRMSGQIIQKSNMRKGGLKRSSCSAAGNGSQSRQ